MHVPQSAVLKGIRGSAQCDQVAVGVVGERVPGVRAVPRHRSASVFGPAPLEAKLVPRADQWYARHRHLQADSHELSVAITRDGQETRRVEAVEQGPRVSDLRPRYTSAERVHRRDDVATLEAWDRGRHAMEGLFELRRETVAA